MVGWHHQFNGREFEQTQEDSKGQGSLVHCSPWGHRVGHNLVTEKPPQQSIPLYIHTTSSLSSKYLFIGSH